MPLQVVQVPKIIKVNGNTIFLNNVEEVFVDTVPTPDQIVIRFRSGVERRFAVNSAEGLKLIAWSQDNPLFEVLT